MVEHDLMKTCVYPQDEQTHTRHIAPCMAYLPYELKRTLHPFTSYVGIQYRYGVFGCLWDIQKKINSLDHHPDQAELEVIGLKCAIHIHHRWRRCGEES